MLLEMDEVLEILEEKFISQEQLQEISENEYVSNIEKNGLSGLHYGYSWFTVILENGEEYDVYIC